MKVIFFGTPQSVIPIAEALRTHFDLTHIVTIPDKKSGRKQIVTPPPVKQYAKEHAIPVLQPDTNSAMQAQLADTHADVFVVASYGKIIPQDVLDIPTYGCINIHPSLLPKYRGPTPIQTTLLNQETKIGITFITMDSQVDHGAILKQVAYPLTPTDTFASLMQDMFAKAADLLPEVITQFVQGTITPARQDDSQASFTRHITKQDGYIDRNHLPDKQTLDAMIRAYYPWPGVWTSMEINNKNVQIKLLPDKKLQMEGKNPVSITDFLNGYPQLREFVEKVY